MSDELQARLDLGPLPRGGYGHTVNSTSDNDNQATGASFRIIADTGDWDRSVGTNTPGQSGDPESPHYRDLFETLGRRPVFPGFLLAAQGRIGHGDRRQPWSREALQQWSPERLEIGTINEVDPPRGFPDIPPGPSFPENEFALEDGCDRLR